MKANEIRIGNWFKFTGKELPTHILDNEIFQWDLDCWNYENEGGNLLQNIEAIPLTEEWLLKFGFKKNIVWEYYTHLSFRSGTYFVEESEWPIYGDFDECVYIRLPEYIHHLQNLCFALIGNELIVNL